MKSDKPTKLLIELTKKTSDLLDKVKDETGLVKFKNPVVIHNFYSESADPVETETITGLKSLNKKWLVHIFLTDDFSDETEEIWMGLNELNKHELIEIIDKIYEKDF